MVEGGIRKGKHPWKGVGSAIGRDFPYNYPLLLLFSYTVFAAHYKLIYCIFISILVLIILQAFQLP